MRNYKIIKSKKRKHFLIGLYDNVYYYTNLQSDTYFAQRAEFGTIEEGGCYYINDRYVLCCEPASCYR